MQEVYFRLPGQMTTVFHVGIIAFVFKPSYVGVRDDLPVMKQILIPFCVHRMFITASIPI